MALESSKLGTRKKQLKLPSPYLSEACSHSNKYWGVFDRSIFLDNPGHSYTRDFDVFERVSWASFSNMYYEPIVSYIPASSPSLEDFELRVGA